MGSPLFHLVVFSLLGSYVGAQEYDETGEFCRKYNVECPNDPSKPYEKYCCIDVRNRVPYPVCCSPYFGIEIGAGIGIPVVLLFIISVIAGYCCCLKVQQRRLAQRQSDYDDSDSEVGDSPLQQYSRLAGEKPPGYSSEDPFPNPPQYSPTPGEEEQVGLQVNPMIGDGSTGSNQPPQTGSSQPPQTGSNQPPRTGSSWSLHSEEGGSELGPISYANDSVPLIGSGHAP